MGDSRVIDYTDSKINLSGLWSKRLQDFLNQLLRNIILIVDVNDILVEQRWLGYKAKGLIDTFSGFNVRYIAKICPSLQNMIIIILHL